MLSISLSVFLDFFFLILEKMVMNYLLKDTDEIEEMKGKMQHEMDEEKTKRMMKKVYVILFHLPSLLRKRKTCTKVKFLLINYIVETVFIYPSLSLSLTISFSSQKALIYIVRKCLRGTKKKTTIIQWMDRNKST